MFFSLNKKFIYTISVFFIFISVIFLYAFYILNLSKIQEEQKNTISRNQQYIEMLYENINLRKELVQIGKQNPAIKFSTKIKELTQSAQLNAQQEQISQERQRAEEALKNYNERYQALEESFNIAIISTLLFLLAMIVLWLLIKIWVLAPIDKLSSVSRLVAHGDYSRRLEHTSKEYFKDEFDNLIKTFNQMLDNIESSIKEIHRTEFFLQSIIDTIPDGIRVLKEDGTIIIANKEYHRQINDDTNCIGQKCYISSQHQNFPCPLSQFTCPLKVLKAQQDTLKFIQQFAAYPNRPLSINAATMTIKDDKHHIQKYIVESIRDLSEDIRFSHQQKLASLGFLSTSVAHEMKNHLGSIRMIIEGLLKKYHNTETHSEEKNYLELINKQLTECINVPERLLKLAQFAPDEQKSYILNDCIQDIISILDYEAKNNGTIINYHPTKSKLKCLGNDADFKMVILNLMQNALKAMPQGGEINIDLSKDKTSNSAKISIKDTGTGIEPEKLPHIFEPFYSQGHSVKTRGTGLGLAIVKSIIEKQKGEISVTSTLGVGSCFTIKIPLNIEK